MVGALMAGNPSYRCDDCIDTPDRCADCRAARAKARRRRREEKRSRGECVECPRLGVLDRETGERMRRCLIHRRDNNERSGASHAKARKAS